MEQDCFLDKVSAPKPGKMT